jgi:hypothetical protein
MRGADQAGVLIVCRFSHIRQTGRLGPNGIKQTKHLTRLQPKPTRAGFFLRATGFHRMPTNAAVCYGNDHFFINNYHSKRMASSLCGAHDEPQTNRAKNNQMRRKRSPKLPNMGEIADLNGVTIKSC